MSKFFHAAPAALIAIVIAATGCTSKNAPTPQNFQTGLNKYFAERQLDCLLSGEQRFPYTTSDPAEQKWLDVLTKEQLLTVKHEQQVARYETTPYGSAIAPRFCYGDRVVTSVDSFTPLSKVGGFNQTTVSYHYRMDNIPLWAKSEDMKAAFPQMATATGGNATAQTVMAQTAVGWQVPE